MISSRYEIKENAPSRAQRLAKKGDVFYQTVRPYQRNNYLFDKEENNYVFSTGYAQLRPNCNSRYLLNLLQTDSFVNIVLNNCTGTSYPAINSSDLGNIHVTTTKNIREQTKIGEIFYRLDNLITLHQRKPKLLSSNLNFFFVSEYAHPWEQRKLSDISERVTRKNKNLEYSLPLTISAQYGLVDQHEFFNKRIAAKDVSGYYVIKNGEFAYNKSYSEGYPWGAVKRLDRYENGVLSTLYILFSVKNVDSDFLVSYYDTNNWHSEVQQRSAEGARNHGLLNISASDFFDTELVIPQDPNEQKKIGLLFKKLDSTITLHQR